MPIADTSTKGKVPVPIEFVSNFELLQMVKDQPPAEPFKLSSFPTLNNNLEGFETGELVVLSGPGGTGKTLFCQTLTKDFCNDGHTPLWFPYEMTPRKFLERFTRNAEDLQFMVPKAMVPYSISWVCNAITQSKERFETEIVIIDHLHYVFDMTNSQHVSLDIGTIMRRLKILAVNLDITIILIAHMNKARLESVDDIGMHSIRDSSFISQESDIVLFIWNKITESGENIENKQIVKICKSRRTGMMFKTIPITKRDNYLVELDRDETTYKPGRSTRSYYNSNDD